MAEKKPAKKPLKPLVREPLPKRSDDLSAFPRGLQLLIGQAHVKGTSKAVALDGSAVTINVDQTGGVTVDIEQGGPGGFPKNHYHSDCFPDLQTLATVLGKIAEPHGGLVLPEPE